MSTQDDEPGTDALAEIGVTERDLDAMLAQSTPVQVVGPPKTTRPPGGPYNDGGVANYFVEVGGRTLQVVPGAGVVVLVPDPAGALVWEPDHIDALIAELTAANAKARAAAHRFPE